MALDVRAASATDRYPGKVAGAGETRAAHAGSAARISSGFIVGCGVAGGDSVRIRAVPKTAEGRPERSGCSSSCP